MSEVDVAHQPISSMLRQVQAGTKRGIRQFRFAEPLDVLEPLAVPEPFDVLEPLAVFEPFDVLEPFDEPLVVPLFTVVPSFRFQS